MAHLLPSLNTNLHETSPLNFKQTEWQLERNIKVKNTPVWNTQQFYAIMQFYFTCKKPHSRHV
jgi:hypothetical protein